MTLDALRAFVMVTAAIALIVADMSKAPSPVISPEMTRNGKAMRMDKWRRLCCSLIRHENTSRCNRKEVAHFSTLQVSTLKSYKIGVNEARRAEGVILGFLFLIFIIDGALEFAPENNYKLS